MDFSKYDVEYKKINGKDYIADTDVDKIITRLDRRNLVLSMRFGREDWKDDEGYCCILNILDKRHGNIVSGIKIHCVNVDGYDYIAKDEFDKIIRDYF